MINYLDFQKEYINSKEPYKIMLAARRVGKTMAGITSVLQDARADQVHTYVCATDRDRDLAVTMACDLGFPIQTTTDRVPRIGNVRFVSEEHDPAHAIGIMTFDEPFRHESLSWALWQAQVQGHGLRIVGGATGKGTLMHQMVDGQAFHVYKTDIDRAVACGYPAPVFGPDEISEEHYRQEYLCHFIAHPAYPVVPALHWYTVLWATNADPALRCASGMAHVPGISCEDACRNFDALHRVGIEIDTAPAEAQAVEATMMRGGRLCSLCGKTPAPFDCILRSTHQRGFLCETCALSAQESGSAIRCLYIPLERMG